MGPAKTADGTSAKEVKVRLVQVHSAMTKPAVRGMSFAIKTKLYIKSLIVSIGVRAARWLQTGKANPSL